MSTVTYTATDAAGNTRTCIYTVNVVNNLVSGISGTATVAQNISTTSNITFSGSGGTKPYTFTYNVNGGATQTIATTGVNSIVTVPQSNAVLGQFIYTLLSVTDVNGCTGTLPADPRDTITIVTTIPQPDLSPTVPRPLNSTFAVAQLREGYVQVSNVTPNPTTGLVVFRISNVSNFTLSIPPAMVTAAGTAVNNSGWTITPGPFFYTIQSNAPPVNGSANIKIGYTLTATGAPSTSGVMTVTVIAGTGGSGPGTGDSNSANNQSIKTFTIN
jgi:hypothetical protein